MPKPIKLTEALIEQMKAEFAEKLAKLKLSDGHISYTRSLTYEKKDGDGATVLFEPVAYAKMLMLLDRFSDEVAWHGLVERRDDRTFVITDILVYPQEVTGATVDTDQERYQQWILDLIKQNDGTFEKMKMQGHSHVNMTTGPSSTDTSFYNSILQQLTDEDFYIFMIFNKRLEHTCMVYDMKNNVMYSNSDITVGIACDSGDLDGFITDAKKQVERKTPAYTYGNGYSYGANTPAASAGKKPDKSKKSGKSAIEQSPGRYGGYDSVTDYDAEIFGRHGDHWWNK